MDFGEALARLFVQAGRPTLRAAASRAKASAQRISDWRNGRHLPRDFATVEPLLLWLTSRAVAAGEADVLSIPQWRELWDRHLEEALDTDATTAPVTRPYAGLATLTAADSSLFFGRDDLVTTLVDTILAAACEPAPGGATDRGPGARIVVVTGVSGSGKSSLLRAGLARDRRLETPSHATVGPAGIRLDPTDADSGDSPAVIVIDQFENAFSLEPDALTSTLLEVERLARDSVVVLGIRADFFEQCVEFPLLADAWQSRCVIVSEMTRNQLREVITGPVRIAGGRIESGLADVMITDLYEASTVSDRAGRLPLLAHVLQATWTRRSGNRMTLSAYRATGGIARAVADTAEAAWAALDLGDQDLARALLLGLVHVGPAGIALRVPLAPATIASRFPPTVSSVIDIFAQARLLTVSTDSVMLVHDVVLTAWPRLAEWIAADSGTHLWRQQLDADTESWVSSGRSRSFLYTGSRLDDARHHRTSLRRTYQHLLSKENDEFLDAAAAQQRRRRLLLIVAAVIVAGLAVASTITAAIGLRQAHDLTLQRNAAERAALLSHIDSMQQTNPSLAARLLLVAHNLYPDDPTVTSRVRGAATSPLAYPLTGHTGPVYDLAFNSDGRFLASAGGDREVRLWQRSADAAGYRQQAVMTGFGQYVTSVSFHPTRPLLASGSGDGTVRLWDISTPSAPRLAATMSPGHGTVYMVRFATDGTTLAASSDDGTITIFSVPAVGAPVETAVLRGHSAAARTLAYSPDGRLLASGGDDRVVRLWTTGPTPVPVGAPIAGFPSITHSVTFGPDSRQLAVTGDSPNAQIWNVADPQRPVPVSTSLPNTTAGSWSIDFSPAGNQLASARADGTVTVWNTANPTTPITQWALQTASEQGSVRTFSAQFSPDGSELVSGRSDGTLDVWSLPSTTHPDHGGTITGIGQSADARILATVGVDTTLNVWTNDAGVLTFRSRTPIQRRVNDHPRVSVNATGTQVATANNNGGVVELWDIRNPSRPRAAAKLEIGTRYSSPVAFAPTGLEGGGILATGADDFSVRLWTTGDPNRPTPFGPVLRGPSDLIRGIAFSPQGDRLAVTSDDKRVYIYDVAAQRAEPIAIIDDVAPVTAAVFSDDGNVLVVASKDLSTWHLPRGEGPATPIDRRTDMHVSTLSLAPSRVIVGTSTHELMSFAISADGKLSDQQSVLPLLATTDSTTTWQFPPLTTADDMIVTGGDTTGAVYQQTMRVEDAQHWICNSTPPLTDGQQEAYLPHTEIKAGC
ncbi:MULTISPECIES: hypothetical protein [unclassified Gordonia (in: high G+C Gram-positive bacteria)]|uniref:nSTAND1 domain-containing NTPase n=1 Tax=unclassified Gordonia (in: high G+C Gram-positive bacteria) TaxID=2657482 RepID=UPI001F0F0B30|nr:hypothetical protein [Gordonia sp. ABSL49_1]MCH5645248.1 hypothetical protein [Gordonia sp. ABSL49_1]